MMIERPSAKRYLDLKSGGRIAYRADRRNGPSYSSMGLFWLSGFKSNMDGTKAGALSKWARSRGLECVRFDYSGHGASDGRFENGTISTWLAETIAIFDEITTGPQVVIGSSMGGWLALLLLRHHMASKSEGDRRIKGLVLIAPAVDMTEALMWQRFPPDIRNQIERDGVYLRPSAYDDGPYAITKALIEDGRQHLILGEKTEVPFPVRILHGLSDPDVPWQHSIAIAEHLDGSDITVTFVKDGDHRLSGDRDILRLLAMIEGLIGTNHPTL